MYYDIDERYWTYCNIRKNVDMVNVVSKYLDLKGGPVHYYSNCPFCKENDNKFFVISNQRVFRCFNCMKAGDVIRFVSEIENISYDEAADKIINDFNKKINISRLKNIRSSEYENK